MRRALIVLALLLAAAIAVGDRSGDQPHLDAVAAATAELGIPFESSPVDVGDVTVHVVQAGPKDGPPILVLHGFPEFWYAWKGPMAPLAKAEFRVIAPDQRGYGDSGKPRDVESYQVERPGRTSGRFGTEKSRYGNWDRERTNGTNGRRARLPLQPSRSADAVLRIARIAGGCERAHIR